MRQLQNRFCLSGAQLRLFHQKTGSGGVPALRTAVCGLHGEAQDVQALLQVQKKAGACGDAVPLLPALVQLPGLRAPHHFNQRVQLSPLRKQSLQVRFFFQADRRMFPAESAALFGRNAAGAAKKHGRVAQRLERVAQKRLMFREPGSKSHFNLAAGSNPAPAFKLKQ